MAELVVLQQELPENPDMSGWPKEREILWKLVRENGSKISTLAQEIGFSRSQVSQYINDVRFNPSDKFVEAVRLYLKKIGLWGEAETEPEPAAEYIKSVNQLKFVLTETIKRTEFVLNATSKANIFGMIVGPSGCGKTAAVEYWLDKPENAGKAILITANGCMGKRAILKRIAKALGIWANSDSDTMIERICDEMKERPKMIIIDEADQLNTVVKLEVLRTLLDGTKTIGIALVGNEDLSEYILKMAVSKIIALSAPGQAMVKLADAAGKEFETTAADAFKNTLLALPEEHRIPLGQRGTQSAGDDFDKIKLACDEDIKMLGGEITADGKYKI